MTDEDAFLAAIDARPDDALTRLVYADWLDERNDERATLIRVMEEMRPLAIWSDEFQRLRADRNRLRKSIDPAWQERMGYAPVHRQMFGTIPERPEHRWRLAEEFIDIWHGGLNPRDGCSEEELRQLEGELGFSMPEQLRHWYRLAGKRRDIWSNQDHFGEIPDWLRRDPSRLTFRWENQNVRQWYVRIDDVSRPDPPVFTTTGNSQVANSVTEFALFVLVFEAQFTNIWCQIDPPAAELDHLIPTKYQVSALPTHYGLRFQFHTWEAEERYLLGEPTGWLMATCRTEAAYQQLVADFGSRVQRND
jgi:uncharacterized protein (TIGR02996 family)